MATLEQQYLMKIEEIKTDEKQHDETKQQKIKDAADLLLKNGMQEDKISARIKQDLKDTVSSTYIGLCLDQKFKEKIKITKVKNDPEKIPVMQTTSGTSEVMDKGTVTNNTPVDKNKAAEDYEKNKYKLKPSDINSVKGSSALERANAELEGTQTNNNEKNQLIQSQQQQIDQLQGELRTRDNERSEHTIVTLPKEKFVEVTKYTTDETVKRILFHFNEDMVITHISVPL